MSTPGGLIQGMDFNNVVTEGGEVGGLYESVSRSVNDINMALSQAAPDATDVQGKINMMLFNMIKNTRLRTTSLENRIALTGTGVPTRTKIITESKGASMLTVYSGQKGEKQNFKEWSDKVINQFSVTYPVSRKIFKEMRQKINETRKAMTNQEIEQMIQSSCPGFSEFDEMKEDMYYIMIDKTSSDAKLKVDAVDAGEGFQAFQNVHLWFAGTSGEMISWKTGKVMNPTPIWINGAKTSGHWRPTGNNTNFQQPSRFKRSGPS